MRSKAEYYEGLNAKKIATQGKGCYSKANARFSLAATLCKLALDLVSLNPSLGGAYQHIEQLDESINFEIESLRTNGNPVKMKSPISLVRGEELIHIKHVELSEVFMKHVHANYKSLQLLCKHQSTNDGYIEELYSQIFKLVNDENTSAVEFLDKQKGCYNEIVHNSIPSMAANADAAIIPDAIWNQVTSFQEIEEIRRLFDAVAGYRLLKEKASNIQLDIANIFNDDKDLDEKFREKYSGF